MKLCKISALIISLLIFSVGCGEKTDTLTKKQLDIFAMDTYMNLTAYGDNAETALENASEIITELEMLLSVTSENSDVWRINASHGESVSVSVDTANIISKAVEYGNLTDDSLDITIYPVLKEWGFTTGNYKIPDDETLENLLENVDYSKIMLNNNT
ncbi:MAG: FAD:protein FMN transferase, partial [Ruminococcus sp.]|nr:FAD:protein FMN transferase [Ruminococcus sp.]